MMYDDYGDSVDGQFADDPYADTWGTEGHAQNLHNTSRQREYYASRSDVYNDYYSYDVQAQTSSQLADTEYCDAFGSRQPQHHYEQAPYESSYSERQRRHEYSYYESAQRTPTPSPPPSSPSPDYLQTAAEPSQCSTPAPRKLLILDLNGTLLLRKERRSIHPRPYMPAFREYLFAPQTREWLDVMVWSSAQPHNVEKMVRRCFFGDDKPYHKTYGAYMNGQKVGVDDQDKWEGKLVAVWARDMLGLSHTDYSRKAKTTKDLEKPWAALSSTPHSARTTLLLDDSPAKARLQPYNHVCIREYADRECDMDVAVKRRAVLTQLTKVMHVQAPVPTLTKTDQQEEGKPEGTDTEKGKEEEASSSSKSSEVDVHVEGKESTLPQSRRKIKKERMRLARQQAEIAKAQEKLDLLCNSPKAHIGELESAAASNHRETDEKRGQTASSPAHTLLKTNEPVSELDSTLLAVIGILDTLQHESNVAGWIHAGGLWAGVTPPSPEDPVILSSLTDNKPVERAASPTDAEVDNAKPLIPVLTSEPEAASSSDTSQPPASPQEPLQELSPVVDLRADNSSSGTKEVDIRSRLYNTGAGISPSVHDVKRQRSVGSVSSECESTLKSTRSKKRSRWGPVLPESLAEGVPGPEDDAAVVPAGNDAQTIGFETASSTTERVSHSILSISSKYQTDFEVKDGATHVPMWFENAETFSIWVERGRKALSALKIQELDGVSIQ